MSNPQGSGKVRKQLSKASLIIGTFTSMRLDAMRRSAERLSSRLAQSAQDVFNLQRSKGVTLFSAKTGARQSARIDRQIASGYLTEANGLERSKDGNK